jgi:hypothetical protein
MVELVRLLFGKKKMFFGVVLGRAQAHNSPDMVPVLWDVYYLVGLIVGKLGPVVFF